MGFGIAQEFFKRREIPNIFPIGNVELQAFEIDKPFFDWLKFCLQKAKSSYSRKNPTIRLWHIFDSERRISDKQILWTAHETDQLTPTEKNIINNTDVVLFTSHYAADIAKANNLQNVGVCPNFFDGLHFKESPTVKRVDEAINFSLIGKFEKRKHTAKILQLWSRMFANNPKYRLNCLINNSFLSEDQFGAAVNEVFQGNIPWNINLLPRQEKNSSVNAIMNASDIDLSGLSGAEGFNLPAFNMLALNKICVVLNAHAHKDFIDNQNVVLVEPSGKEPVYDGMFFVQGNIANQGNMYSFDEFQVQEKVNEAVNLFLSGKKVNSDLSTKFSVSNTVDILLSHV
jgi:hypothetical protein